MSVVGWRLIKRLTAQIPSSIKNEQERLVILPNGGEIQVRSADNPDSLRGEGLDFLVMDECAFIKESAWTEALRPALSDRKGGALFISTPKGMNWFWRLWLRGERGEGGWRSWQMPTGSNPFIDADEIAEAKGHLPERVFAQEYLAQFLEDAGGVFRHVIDCATAIVQEPLPLHQYVVGVDWGKYHDWTVITVLDITDRRMVYLDRFNQIDYQVQLGRLEAVVERYMPIAIVAERNSMGDPLIEQLERRGWPMIPWTMTNASKSVAADALALAFEKREIEILPDTVLTSELQAFEMNRLPSGMLRYAAPDGMHDDTVISLMLAWQGFVFDDVAAIEEGPPPWRH